MSNLDNHNKINQMYDYYGQLLTAKQKEYFELYYFEDLSLQEIADLFNVSRNAIHLNLQKSVKLLNEYEKKLNFIYRYEKVKSEILKTETEKKINLSNIKDLI
jgi:predicted DNA-binding protein YlxM (UPF0122 family)